MQVCNLQENKELAKSIGNTINASIKQSLASNTAYRLVPIMKSVYDKSYSDDQNTVRALGIAAVVPKLFLDVLKLKPEYISQLLDKGFLMDPVYKFIKDIDTAKDPLDITAKLLNIAYTPTISQINKNASTDPEHGIVLEFSDSITKVKSKLLTSNTFLATSGNNRISINETDPNLNFNYKVQQNILKAQTDKDPTFETVEYSGHKGFKLRLMLATDVPNPEKNLPGINILPENYVQVIVDNKGNFLYFNDNFQVSTEDEGKLVGFPQRSWNKEVNKKLLIESFLSGIKPFIEKETTDPAQVAIRMAEVEKSLSQTINKEIEELNNRLDDINSNRLVLANITGGINGAITDPSTITRDMAGKPLTKEQKAELQKPLSEFKISDKSLKSILTLLNKVVFDNYPTPIGLKGTLIAEKDPALLDTLVNLLTEDLVEDGQPVSANRKIKLFHQFTYPSRVKLSEVNKTIAIAIDGVPLNLQDKEAAKAKIKEALSNKVNGGYFAVMKPQGAANSYEEVSISGNTLTTKTSPYLPFISKYVIPKIIYDKTTGEPMVINGFFNYKLIDSKEQENQENKDIIKKGNDATGFDAKDIDISGFDRSKLLDSRSNREQKALADEWVKTSAIVNAKDPVTGKLLFPITRLQNIVNSDAFATFSRAGFTLYHGSDSTHMYHEAWHAFSQVFMTRAERTRLYKAVTTLPGSFTVLRKVGGPGVNNIEEVTLNFKDLDANDPQHRLYMEEFIAEEFRAYAMNNGKFKVKDQKASKLEKFFRAVWEWLKAAFRFTTPANVYSNPGSQGVLGEAFNVLYTAKEESDLNNYSPNIENAEFGTLNSGAIYDVDGNMILSPVETDLLRRSMDGIISATTTKLILEKNAYGAAFTIFSNPNWLKNLYNNVIKKELQDKAKTLTEQLEEINKKIAAEKNEMTKVLLESNAETISNRINTLTKALANYGNIEGILENKVADNSIVAYHLDNSTYRDIIKNAIHSKDEDDKDPNPLDILSRTGGVKANEVEASKLATIDAVYILSSLVKEKFVNGERVTETNELGFPEPIQFKQFFDFLMLKLGGQQSVGRLYNKLVEIKKLKINPLVDQLLDKMGNPDEVMTDKNAVRMWFALVGALNLTRTDLINTKFTTEKGVTTVTTGKVSARYFAIKNDIWPSKFSMDTSIFTKINSDNQNTINLSEVYKKFLTKQQDENGNVFYTLSSKVKASDFLSSISIYLSDKIESEKRLREKNIDGGLKQIYNIIGHAYANGVEINDIVKFLSKKNNFQGVTITAGKSTEKVVSFPSLVGTINTIAQIEADLGTESSNQMVPTSDNEIQSVNSLNSSFTRIGYALNNAQSSTDFGNKDSEFGYASNLNPSSNPSAESSIVLNSLYDPHSKTRNENNNYDINILSGAQHEVVTQNDTSIDKPIEGVSSARMTNTDRFVNDISSMLQAGYIEGPANGDKSSFIAGRVKILKTYNDKQSNHLFVDTDAFIIDKDGNWLTNVNPILEIYNIMIPKLQSELKRIAMYENGISDEQAKAFGLKEGQGKDFYKKHVSGFENAGSFDVFDDILETNEDIDIKAKLINEYLPQLSDTVSLNDLLNKDLPFKRLIAKEIYDYFKAQAEQIYSENYQKIFANKLPDFLEKIVTANIKDRSVLSNVSVDGLIKAAVMSFAVNSTLYTHEQLIIEYGNGYEFNHAKDEYSKRTSPYNSPGKIIPSDSISIKMLNLHVPRAYEAKRIKDGKINKKEVNTINRIGNKAIIQESVVRLASDQYKSYHDLFKTNFQKRGITDERELAVLLYGEKDGQVGTYDNPVGGAMESFAAIKNADGQGYVGFDFYRAIKFSENNWSEEQEEAYQKEVNGEPISAKELTELFPVLKEGYAGALALDSNILAIQSVDKFSLLPLIPSLVKDTPFEIIHDKMMEQNIDYVMFQSSAKRSFIMSGEKDANGNVAVGDPIFMPGDTSKLDPRFLSGEITFTKNPFFMEYLKNQTEVNKEFKEEGTLSTQYRKIFDIGLYGQGVPVDANMSKQEWDKLSESQKEAKSPIHAKVNKVFRLLDKLVKQMGIDLLEEMNWEQDGDKFKGTPEDLITFLKKRLEGQGYTEEQLAILDISKEHEFPDLSISAVAARLEKFLFSIVNNKMIRLKVTGDPLVQASNAGMQKFRSRLTDEEKEKYTDKDLQGYIVTPSGTIGCKVKIAITENYSNLYKTKYYKKNEAGEYVEDGIIAVYKTLIDPKTKEPVVNKKTNKPIKVIDDEVSLQRLNEMIKLDTWLNSDKNREKIQISGLRIPGQSPNSTEFGEVWEFLPAAASNIIIIPAEIIAKAGSDFDVDKLNTYIKFISRQGTLLEDTMGIEEAEKELEEVENILKHHKADKLNINNALDKFRKKIYKAMKHVNMTQVQIKSLTTRDYRKLLSALSDEKTVSFLKKNVKAAYNIYQKEIKGITDENYDGIEDTLDALYAQKSEIYYYVKRKSDLMDYIDNYSQVVMNSLVDAIIQVQKSPELAFSLLLPNGTYLVKPYADELKPVIQKIDNSPNFNLSIKTGKQIKGRKKGVSPTRAVEYNYNKDKRQGNLDAKNSLGVIALEIPMNGIFNKIGAELESSIKEEVKIPNQKGIPEKTEVESNIFIYLPHNYNTYKEATKTIRAISISNIYTRDKINQIADILSQLGNGAVDAAKDNWIAYLQGNSEGITKILAMLEMGVPISNIAYFINNPLIRKYISIKRDSRSKLLDVYEKYNPNNYNATLFKNQYAIAPALLTPDAAPARFSTTSFWGLGTMLKGYMKYQGLDINTFNEANLKEVAYSSMFTNDNTMKAKQIAGFLQYLYIEKLVKPFDLIKEATDLDRNTNVDSQSIFSKLMIIEEAEREHILGKNVMKDIKETSMISMFYPVLKFSRNLLGKNLLKFRTNTNLETFIYNVERSKKWDIKTATGYDEESFGNKFKNAISQHAFTTELKQYKEGSTHYKGISIDELFNDKSPVKSIEQVINDYTSKNYTYDTKNPNNFFARGFYTIPVMAVNDLTGNDFVELILEREFLRKKAMPFTDMLAKSRHFQSIKKSIKDTSLGQTLNDEDLTKWAYEKLITNEALLNTFNNWQMFSSNDYSIANKFFNIKNNYPELASLYGDLLDRISSDTLKDLADNVLNKNLKIKAPKEIDKALASYFTLLWKDLANTGNIKKAVALKNAEANKYVSQFFQQLPIFMFLQSGLNSSKFSFNTIMPTEDYMLIMSNALKNFEKEYLTGKPQDNLALQGLFNLFIQINSLSTRSRLNRGNNYKKSKNQLLSLASAPLNLYTQPFIRPTDNKRVFLLDVDYTVDGVKKRLTAENISGLRATHKDNVIFFLNSRDFDITGTNVEENKNRITTKINQALASGKTIVLNSNGFSQELLEARPQAPVSTGKVLEGDIFTLPGIPVITTNLGGVHGAGLAQAAKSKGLIKQGEGNFKATDDVVQLPVKKKWSDDMSMNNNMELLKESLRSLIKVSKENPTKNYLLPLAGLGHGEGSIEEILPLLIKTVQASPNIKLVIPAEGVSLGRQGTVRKDYTRENLPKIKAMLSEAGLSTTQPQAPVSQKDIDNLPDQTC